MISWWISSNLSFFFQVPHDMCLHQFAQVKNQLSTKFFIKNYSSIQVLLFFVHRVFGQWANVCEIPGDQEAFLGEQIGEARLAWHMFDYMMLCGMSFGWSQICFIFPPPRKIGGNDPIWHEHIFRLDWFNHQLVMSVVNSSGQAGCSQRFSGSQKGSNPFLSIKFQNQARFLGVSQEVGSIISG